MVYSLKNDQDKQKIQQQYDSNIPISKEILIKSLHKHALI